MALQITVYLTPEQIPATEVDARVSDSSTIYLMPDNMVGQSIPLFVDLFLIQPSANPVQCEYKPKVTVGHVWSPDPALPGSAAPFLTTAALVKADIPKSPFWAAADFNPQLTSDDASLGPTPETSTCPESDTDVLLIPDNGWEITCHPVPGEELRVTHGTHGHGSFAISGYHSCVGMTGGWIVSRTSHPTVSGAYIYDVEVEGQLFTGLLPSDWEPRSTGQWCFLLRRNGSDDINFSASTPGSPSANEPLMLAPVSVLGKG